MALRMELVELAGVMFGAVLLVACNGSQATHSARSGKSTALFAATSAKTEVTAKSGIADARPSKRDTGIRTGSHNAGPHSLDI